MSPTEFVKISERARHVYDHAIAAFYVSDHRDREHHEREVEEEFKRLAALLGYTVARPALVAAE